MPGIAASFQLMGSCLGVMSVDGWQQPPVDRCGEANKSQLLLSPRPPAASLFFLPHVFLSGTRSCLHLVRRYASDGPCSASKPTAPYTTPLTAHHRPQHATAVTAPAIERTMDVLALAAARMLGPLASAAAEPKLTAAAGQANPDHERPGA